MRPHVTSRVHVYNKKACRLLRTAAALNAQQNTTHTTQGGAPVRRPTARGSCQCPPATLLRGAEESRFRRRAQPLSLGIQPEDNKQGGGRDEWGGYLKIKKARRKKSSYIKPGRRGSSLATEMKSWIENSITVLAACIVLYQYTRLYAAAVHQALLPNSGLQTL